MGHRIGPTSLHPGASTVAPPAGSWHKRLVTDDRPPASKRTFDVRAPRATRSTKDSALFPSSPPPSREPRPRRDRGEPRPPRGERAERPAPERREPRADVDRDRRELPNRRPAHERAQPPMPQRAEAAPAPAPARTPAAARPSSPAPARSPAPKRAPAPASTPTPTPAPAPSPAGDSIEDQLRILGARPVTEARPKKEKPKTAKEALRARTGATAKGPATKKARARAEVARTIRRADIAESAAAEGADENDEDVIAPESEAEPESEASPPKKPGIWAKIRAFFGGS